MYYQNYEDYMRQVLGYQTATANDDYDDGYYQVAMSVRPATQVPEEKEELYPEIYRLVYPMVCKACDEAQNREITEELVEELTNTIYINLEPEETTQTPQKREESRNGDVKNPYAKEEVRETRQSNPVLRDLIRILVLRRLFDRRPRTSTDARATSTISAKTSTPTNAGTTSTISRRSSSANAKRI